MSMMSFTRHLLVAAAIGLSSASALAADISARTIRFGYGLNEDSVQGRATAFLIKEMDRLSGGKFKLVGFGASSIGSDMQMQTALIGGVQEMMVGSTATLVGLVKEFGVFDFPFLFNNEAEADAVLDGPFGAKLLAKLESKGLIGLAYWENGFRNLTNSVRPVNKLEDMAGIKLRVMQNQVALDVFRTLGTNAVPMSFSELFSALETGVVDGQENPVATIDSSKFYEVQKYLTLTRHVYSPWVVLASKKWWDRLTPDEREIVTKAVVASRDFERKDNRAGSEKSMEVLRKAGMQINTIPDAEMARMRERVQPVTETYSKEYGEELSKELFATIAKIRG